MKRLNRSLIAVAVLAAMLLPAVVRAQLLQHVPPEALLVIKINKLEQFSQRISNLARASGLVELNPMLGGDPLMMAQGITGVTQGLNKGGDAAWVLLNVEGDDPTFLGLLPVTDYAAFLKGLGQAQMEGPIAQVTKGGQDLYVTHWGDFAALSNQKAVVQEKPAGLKVEGLVQNELNDNDFTVYLNMPAVKNMVLPLIQGQREMIRQQITQELQENPDAAQYEPLVDTVVNQFMDMVEGFFQNTQALTYGVDLREDGIGSTFVAAFQPGSYPANLVQKIDGTQEPLVAVLPNLQYIFWGGYALNPEVTQQLISDIVDPALKEIQPLGEEFQPAVDYIQAIKQLSGATGQQAFGLIAPTAPLGQEPLYQMIAIAQGDARTIAEAQRKMFEAQKQLPMLTGGQMDMELTFTPDAATIAGVKLDKFEADINIDAQNPEEAQMQQFMDFYYGPGGPSGHMGAINDNLYLFAMGLPEPALEQAVEAAKAQGGKVSEAVQKVSQKLPQQRVGVVYFAPDVLAATALRYAGMMGFPVQIEVPQGLPPIGTTVATEGTALRSDSYVSAELIKALVQVAQQAQAQAMGGMGAEEFDKEFEEGMEEEGMGEEEQFEDLGAEEGGL